MIIFTAILFVDTTMYVNLHDPCISLVAHANKICLLVFDTAMTWFPDYMPGFCQRTSFLP